MMKMLFLRHPQMRRFILIKQYFFPLGISSSNVVNYSIMRNMSNNASKIFDESSFIKHKMENIEKNLSDRQSTIPPRFGMLKEEKNGVSESEDITEELLAYRKDPRAPPTIIVDDEDDTDEVVLYKTHREYSQSFFINKIERLLKEKKYYEAVDTVFQEMIEKLKLLPSRAIFHLVLDGLTQAGDSSTAFIIYKKMQQLDIECTQGTYTRLISIKDMENLPLQRTLDLFQSLKEQNRIIYMPVRNAFLYAIAKSGDLDMFLSMISEFISGTKVQDATPIGKNMSKKQRIERDKNRFVPDSFTVTNICTAIGSSSCKNRVPNFEIFLNIWIQIRPYFQGELSSHAFTAIANILSEKEPVPTKGDYVMKLSSSIIQLHGNMYENTVKEAERILKLSAESEVKKVDNSIAFLEEEECRNDGDSPTSAEPFTVDLRGCSSKTLDSSINLLSNCDHDSQLIIKGCQGGFIHPWQKLALFGGIKGFLKSVPQPTNFLFSRLAMLLPAPDLDSNEKDMNSKLDLFETELLRKMGEFKLTPDLPIFNVLINRRSLVGLKSQPILSAMSRDGIHADLVTWCCLAKGVRTKRDMNSVINAYFNATGVSDVPVQLYNALLRGVKFRWPAKSALLDYMQSKNFALTRRMIFEIEDSIHKFTRYTKSKSAFSQEEKRVIKQFRDFVIKYKKTIENSKVQKSQSPVKTPLLNDKKIAKELESYVDRTVNIITSDGRSIVGTLKGFDHVVNLIVTNSHERVFSPNDGVERVPLGLHIIRGQNVACIGEIDENLDRRIDFANLRAEPLNPIQQ